MTKDLVYYLRLKYPVEVQEREDRVFVFHPDLDGCMAEGGTVEEAISNLADSRELWIEARLMGGYDVPEPPSDEYSGKLTLRMTPELHGQLVRLADRQGVSLSLLLNSVIASYAGGADPLLEITDKLKSTIADMHAAVSPIGRLYHSSSPKIETGSLRQGLSGLPDNVRPFRQGAGL